MCTFAVPTGQILHVEKFTTIGCIILRRTSHQNSGTQLKTISITTTLANEMDIHNLNPTNKAPIVKWRKLFQTFIPVSLNVTNDLISEHTYKQLPLTKLVQFSSAGTRPQQFDTCTISCCALIPSVSGYYILN